MPIFRKKIDKQLEDTADAVMKDVTGDKKYGSAILTHILVQVGVILLKKLLERIIENNGQDVVALAKSLSENIDENRRAFGETNE